MFFFCAFYSGYASTFEWSGEHRDKTPRNANLQRESYIVAIDAKHFSTKGCELQLKSTAILRELNKSYCGFSCDDVKTFSVSTGNWGCGVFNGDPHIKTVIQLLACSAAVRAMHYSSFGNQALIDDILPLHAWLRQNGATVGQLFQAVIKYQPVKGSRIALSSPHCTLT